MSEWKYRLAEMAIGPPMLLVILGLIHLSEGRPLLNDFEIGGAFAIFIIRGMDALSAYVHHRESLNDPKPGR